MCGQSWDTGSIDKVTDNHGEYEVQGKNNSTLEEHSYLKRKINIGLPFHHKQNIRTRIKNYLYKHSKRDKILIIEKKGGSMKYLLIITHLFPEVLVCSLVMLVFDIKCLFSLLSCMFAGNSERMLASFHCRQNKFLNVVLSFQRGFCFSTFS